MLKHFIVQLILIWPLVYSACTNRPYCVWYDGSFCNLNVIQIYCPNLCGTCNEESGRGALLITTTPQSYYVRERVHSIKDKLKKQKSTTTTTTIRTLPPLTTTLVTTTSQVYPQYDLDGLDEYSSDYPDDSYDYEKVEARLLYRQLSTTSTFKINTIIRTTTTTISPPISTTTIFQSTTTNPINDKKGKKLKLFKKPSPIFNESMCDEEYGNVIMPPNAIHSLCLKRSKKLLKLLPLPPSIKEGIIDFHNDARSKIKPRATNMQKIYWDDELARVASGWSAQCIFAHDCPDCRKTKFAGHMEFSGQNAAVGYAGNWTHVMRAWFHEEWLLWKYGVGPKRKNLPWQKIAHMTQMAFASSSRVGCAISICKPGRTYFFCNYLAAQTSYKRPYEKGPSCEKCPNSCSENLCDCKGKYCVNRGRLNENNCQCECSEKYWGKFCEKKRCGDLDCNRARIDYENCTCKCPWYKKGKFCEILQCHLMADQSYCGRRSDVCKTRPFSCPFKCKLCKKEKE
ncbi:hypothetical protein SNEBB_006029 [Seison nebaliae]|nr:hypothetical protein SNEBB_006029 [Seison nebaliae]